MPARRDLEGVEFSAYGSWTLQSKLLKLGLEPDECYVPGGARDAERPDLASEALPSIDLDQLASFLDRESTSAAIREYRAALRTGASMP